MPTGEPAAPREANTARAIWALTAGTFALALNLNVLAPLLPDIGRSFGASPETRCPRRWAPRYSGRWRTVGAVGR